MEYHKSGHSLQRNHGNAVPRHIMSIDTETVPIQSDDSGLTFDHRFRLGVAITGCYRRDRINSRKVHFIADTASFWELVERQSDPRHTLWIVAHNALFDLVTLKMPDEVSDGRFTIDAPRARRKNDEADKAESTRGGLCCLESPPFILGLRCEKTQGRVVIVDTLNWFRSSLSELAISIGTQKFVMPAFDDTDSVWQGYCEQDATIVFDAFVALIKWQRENDLGVFRYTAASQAMGAYRHRFMPCKIMFHDNPEVKKIERSGFVGGRTECFRLGKIAETVYQLDVNSLYPSVMISGEFPRRLNVYDLDDKAKPLPDLGGWHRCLAEVDIRTDKPLYPFRNDGITIYPIGEFRTILCGVELQNAVNSGHVVSVGRWAKYNTAPLFGSFVAELWAMRQKYKQLGNVAYDSFCKIMLNSLFGKFAQRPIHWVPQPDRIDGLEWAQWCEIDWQTKRPIMHRCIGGTVYAENQETEREDTMISISAFIAAEGRVKMNGLRSIAGVDNVYYQGVDGLLVSQSGYDRLKDSGECSETELGKLRLIIATNCAEIHNVADYRVGDRVTIAGRSKLVTGSDPEKLQQRRFSGIESLFGGKPQQEVRERIVEWRRSGQYRKGQKLATGWVDPFVI